MESYTELMDLVRFPDKGWRLQQKDRFCWRMPNVPNRTRRHFLLRFMPTLGPKNVPSLSAILRRHFYIANSKVLNKTFCGGCFTPKTLKHVQYQWKLGPVNWSSFDPWSERNNGRFFRGHFVFVLSFDLMWDQKLWTTGDGFVFMAPCVICFLDCMTWTDEGPPSILPTFICFSLQQSSICRNTASG